MSYAARIVLANSVLLSIHTYWAQVSVLPKTVIDKIVQICRSFLWDGKVILNRPPCSLELDVQNKTDRRSRSEGLS